MRKNRKLRKFSPNHNPANKKHRGVERLADISEEDAIKEGIKYRWDEANRKWSDYKKEFKNHWNATHKKPEEKFEALPWVWVVSFSVINN